MLSEHSNLHLKWPREAKDAWHLSDFWFTCSCWQHCSVVTENQPHGMSPLDPHDEVACDMESPLEVGAGGNVTIRCEATPGSRYMWTKVTWKKSFIVFRRLTQKSYRLIWLAELWSHSDLWPLNISRVFTFVPCLWSCQFGTNDHIHHVQNHFIASLHKSDARLQLVHHHIYTSGHTELLLCD